MALPNVRLVGWIREEIPGYFKTVDVCLIPFLTDSEYNQYRNPNKLHEYIEMGKPVVSTDIQGVHSLINTIYIARTKEEFVVCVDRTLAEDGPARIAERMRRARENTWERRSERMLEIVQCLWQN